MKKTAYLLLSLSLIVACTSYRKASKSKVETSQVVHNPIPISDKVKKGVLSNGLTYYIQQNPKPEEKVELRLVVNVGSILEDKKQLGLAHFMEHMNFNGSKNFNKNELVDYLQSIGVKFGAHLNAYTGFDETVYILPIPTDDDEKLEKGFQILEDWAFNASLTDEEIDKERGVVLEEYRLGLGADKKMLDEYLPKLMYQSQYAERLPIGKKEIIENFTYEDLRRFYKDWYRPDLMAVIAVGDVDAHILEEKVKTHFGKYKSSKDKKERKEFEIPNHQETVVSVAKDKEASGSNVRVFFKDQEKSGPIKTKEEYKEEIVKGLLFRMFNNRLSELREKEKPPFIYGYGTYRDIWARYENAYQLGASSDDQEQMKAFKTLLTENERALRYGFLSSEFESAKKSLLNGYERAYKERVKRESKSYAGEYVSNFLEGEVIPGIEWEFATVKELLPTIDIETCHALLKKMIHEDNRVVIFTGPDKEGIPTINKEDVLAVFEEVKNAELEPYKDASAGKKLMSFVPEKGKIINEEHDSIVGVTRLKLNNGAKVVYKKTDFKDNQILFAAQSYGGMSLYSNEELKKTMFANYMMKNGGVNGLEKTDLKKILSGKTVSVSPFLGSISEGFSGSVSPKDIESLFQLTHLYFTKLNYNTKAFNSHIHKMKAYIKNAMSRPTTYFRSEVNKFLNQENPRYVGFPTKETLDHTDYTLAYKKYQERFADASDFSFYFVGSINEEEIKRFAELYLASLPSTNTKEIFKDNGDRPIYGDLEKHIEKGSEPKSLVEISFRGETIFDLEESYHLKSLGEILSIKLIEKLREEESGVYGVRASGGLKRHPYGAYNFKIVFPCGPENIGKLKSKALAELQKIIDNGPEEKDLNKVKETQLLEYKENQNKNGYWLNRIKRTDFNQLPLTDGIENKERIEALTTQDIQDIAKKYATKNMFVAILKPVTE